MVCKQKVIVNKFLFCLSLETGGISLGWLTAIIAVIASIFYTFVGISLMIDMNSGTEQIGELTWKCSEYKRVWIHLFDFSCWCRLRNFRDLHVRTALRFCFAD